MIYDIIAVGIFVLLIVIGVFRGAARMLIGLGFSFLSFVAASWLGKLAAGWIYGSFIAPSVHSSVSDAAGKVADDAAGFLQQLPWWLQQALGISGKDLSRQTVDLSSGAGDAVNAVVQPIITGVLSIVLTIVLFFLLRFILRRLLMKPILAVFKLPIINGLNKALGGFLGAVEGVLAICMLAFILKLLLPYIDTNISFLNENTIYNSFIFYHFYSGNIFTALASWIR